VTRIRDSLPGEAAALEALQRRASDVWEEYRDQLAAHPEAISVPAEWIDRGLVRVAVSQDDRVLGFAVVLDEELDGLFVEPDAMRGGIGRLLVEDAAARGRAAGLSALHVTGNPNAREFYERVGFVVTGEVPTRFGPGVRMRLAL
jgi:GNAT superfamily N-acetyltransferase